MLQLLHKLDVSLLDCAPARVHSSQRRLHKGLRAQGLQGTKNDCILFSEHGKWIRACRKTMYVYGAGKAQCPRPTTQKHPETTIPASVAS